MKVKQVLAAALLLVTTAQTTSDAIVIKPSQAPGGKMTREKYQTYLNLFNHRDPRFTLYYDPAIVFDHGDTGGMLRGREGILSYYRNAWKELHENVSAGEVIIDNENGVMAVELTTDLTATADVVSTPGIKMKKGDRLVLKEVVLYGLRHGLITWVRGPEQSRKMTRAGE